MEPKNFESSLYCFSESEKFKLDFDFNFGSYYCYLIYD